MRKFKKCALITILSFIIPYILLTICNWHIDISKWEASSRSIVFGFAFLIAVVLWIITYVSITPETWYEKECRLKSRIYELEIKEKKYEKLVNLWWDLATDIRQSIYK